MDSMDNSGKIKPFPIERIVRTPQQITVQKEVEDDAKARQELSDEIRAMMQLTGEEQGAAEAIKKYAKTPANPDEVTALMAKSKIKGLAEKVLAIEVTSDGSWSETSSPASIADAFLKKIANLRAGHL